MEVPSTDIRKIGLIPFESRTEEDRKRYKIYAKARDCTTGSMKDLMEALDMDSVNFYSRLDGDLMFREAVLQGFSDGRSARLLELESSLIKIAIGHEVVETGEGIDANGNVSTFRKVKQVSPNLTALQVLLEKYRGSSWSISQKVPLEDSATTREVPYRLLTKTQLKKLSKGDEK